MSQQPIPLKVTARRFARAVKIFLTSHVGQKARLLLFALLALFCSISALNVVNSFVGRHFMTAIAEKQSAEFVRQAFLYAGVFAASTIVSVIARFAEESVALLWREFLTHRAVGLYMGSGTFYRVKLGGKLAYPDQRIADDINAFTITTLSFVLMLLNSVLTIITFSGVLWVISPLLFIAAVIYAAFGSYMTIVLGRPLISLNYNQLDAEAAFRSNLIRVRENAESIVLEGGEERHTNLLLKRFDELAANFKRIIVLNRNVGFFTTGYNWMIQIIPVVIIAPVFFRGGMDFGAITQSAAAFAILVGAFSFIVSQFKSISNFAAIVARLSSLMEAMEEARQPKSSNLELVERDGELVFDHVTLMSPAKSPLLVDLSATVPTGRSVLVVGDDEAVGTELFRATAGISTSGSGRIARPGPSQIRFIPQRPYLPPGTLRQVLVASESLPEISDEQILELLNQLGLGHLVSAWDLSKEQDWGTVLSPREQHLLAVANVLIAAPRYVLVERGDVTFGHEQMHHVLALFAERSITCINFSEPGTPRGPYDIVLECHTDGSWTWLDQREGREENTPTT